MPCLITKGRVDLVCKDAVAGIRAMYVANFNEYAFTIGVNIGQTGPVITGIVDGTGFPVGVTGSTGSAFYKYELKHSGNTISQEVTSSRDNGTTSFKQTLVANLQKINSELEYQLLMMTYGRPQVIVETNGGDYILLGRVYGTEVTTKSEIQGAMTGANLSTATFVAEESSPFFFLASTAITQLLNLVATTNMST
jgi:hypothetical protein